MYSFLFLVFRTTAVVMQASIINDESKKIVPEIFTCPTHSYSIEVRKLTLLVTNKTYNINKVNKAKYALCNLVF